MKSVTLHLPSINSFTSKFASLLLIAFPIFISNNVSGQQNPGCVTPDIIAPVITPISGNIQIMVGGSGNKTISLADIATVTDNCNPSPATNLNVTSIYCSNGGQQNITVTATDGIFSPLTPDAVSFTSPQTAVVDAAGNIYVAANNQIRKISVSGEVTTLAGSGADGTNDGTGLAASFSGLHGLAIDAAGNIYTAEITGRKVRKVSPEGVVTTVAGSGAIGTNDGPAASASFIWIYGVVVDPQGNIFIVDAGSYKVRKISTAGIVSTYAGTGQVGSINGPADSATFNYPSSIAIDNDGNIYVGEQFKIRKITPSGIVSTFAGSTVTGNMPGNGTNARMARPMGMVFDAAGNLFATQEGDGRIIKVTPTADVSTFAGHYGETTINGTGTAATFRSPEGLGIDATGNLYVADWFLNNIRKITPAAVVTTFAGSGIAGSQNGNIGGITGNYTSLQIPVTVICETVTYPGSLYVNDNNTIGDRFTTAIGNDDNTGTADSPLATFEFALSVAQPGDTIYLDAGVYSLQNNEVFIDKSITILGSNYDIDPNDENDRFLINSLRNTEAQITEGELVLDDSYIQISGCSFSGTGGGVFIRAYDYIPVDNLTIRNNIFKVGETIEYGVILAGASGEEIFTENYIIQGNRFEDHGTNDQSWSTGLEIGDIKNITITGNTFIGRRTSEGEFISLGIGFSFSEQKFDQLTCSNNYFDTLSLAAYFPTISNSTITANISRQTQYTFQLEPNANATCTNVEISENQIMHGKGPAISIENFGTFEDLRIMNNIIDIRNPKDLNDAAIHLKFWTVTENGLVQVVGNKINIFNNYEYFPELMGVYTGVSVFGDHRNTTLHNNEIIYEGLEPNPIPPFNGYPYSTTGINIETTIDPNYPSPTTGEINITNNIIQGFKTSVAFYNYFPPENTPEAEYYGWLAEGMVVNINNNSFSGDSMSINNGINSEMVNANCNWYSSPDSAVVATKVSNSTVNYIPFLSFGGDQDLDATGFQPLPGICGTVYPGNLYVNDNNTTGDRFTTAVGDNNNTGTAESPFATIDFAIAVAQPGDTIYVDAGNYDFNYDQIVDRSLTILGPNYDVNPNNVIDPFLPSIIRNAEAEILQGAIRVEADNTEISGFKFSAGVVNTNSIYMNQNAPRNKLLITNNIFLLREDGMAIMLSGTSGTEIINQGYTIVNNRFEDITTENPEERMISGIFVENANNISISGNSFIGKLSSNGNRLMDGLSVGSAQLISDSLICTGNYFDTLATAMIVSSISNSKVNNNVSRASLNSLQIDVPSDRGISNVEVAGNNFRDIKGLAIYVGNANIVDSLFIRDNEFEVLNPINLNNGAITLQYYLEAPNGLVRLEGNKINIMMDYPNMAEFPGVMFGIWLIGDHRNSHIVNNEIIYTGRDTVSMPVYNNIPSSHTAIVISTGTNGSYPQPSGEINITNNKIEGFKTSFATYNLFVLEGSSPEENYGGLQPGMIVNINDNSFTSDSMSINNGTVSETINANCNWYGSANEFDIVQRISTSTVNYTPWLIDGGDYETELTGFQPLPGGCGSITYPGSLYVNDNNTSGDRFTTAIGNDANLGTSDSPLATIDFAFSVAQPGDTIYVDAGSYNFIDDALILNKTITILGTNYDVIPNDVNDPFLANTSRNAEAEILQGLIQTSADNIFISGLKLSANESNPYSIYMDENEPGNEITITNNIFLLNEATQSIWMVGVPGEEIISHGYFIANNRFEDATIENPGETGMGSIGIGNLKNITISDNSFIGKLSMSGGHMMGGIISTDNQQKIDSLSCNRNYFDTLSTAVNLFSNSNSIIDNNVSRFTQNVLQFDVPQEQSLSNVEVSGNNFTQVKGTAIYVYNANFIENLVISNNEIEVTDPIYLNASGIFLNFAQEAPNGLVTVQGNKLNISLNYAESAEHPGVMMGVWLVGDHRNTNINNNEIIYSGQDAVLLPANYLVPSTHTGILISTGSNVSYPQPSGEINITNNKIEGFKTSFATYSPSEENYGGLQPGIIVNINNNSFTGDSISINNGIVSETINANCNWYGGSDSAFVAEKISLGTVGYEPWLMIGTDIDVATGFQPVPGSCDYTPLFITIDLKTDVTCFNANNGNISITVTGGTAPYTYAWTKDPDPDIIATTDDITGITPGTYRITVTDAYNITATLDITINEPEELTVAIEGTDNLCYGAMDGQATVTVNGGRLPYTYSWNTGQTTETISNLAAGTYTVTVIDSSGCQVNETIIINEPLQLSAVASGSNNICFNGSIGSASVLVEGGTQPYTYEWSNGAFTDSIFNLIAGTYTVTVTDANGCTAEASYQVTQPANIIIGLTITSTPCSGSVVASPTGGTAPYTYSWSNGATTESITNVPLGQYTVTVTDVNGCTRSRTFAIIRNGQINPTVSLTHVSCFGGSDGSITVTSAGSTPPHTYNINGSAFQSGNIFNNLPAGTYIVGAQDANGCMDYITRTITQPAILTVVLDSLKIPCGGVSNGRIYITPGGGTGAKTYSWTGPNGFTSTVQDPNNVAAGNYNVIVTDAKGCTATLNVVLNERPLVSISEVMTPVACRGGFTGSINITVTGGSGLGFTYSWTGPTGFIATTEDVSGLKAGNYTVNVTDIDNGCVVSKLIVVTQPAAVIGLTTTKTNVTGCNSLGTITGSGTGGTAPYQYSLNGTNYQSSGSFGGLYGGTYTVWVKDANGCTTSRSLSITDNGNDEYEGNNTKNMAKLINIGAIINGRIAIAVDAADWFKFITPAGSANYILSFTHPSVSFTFNMYAAGNNTPALVPVSTTATTKEYVLTGNTTYFISITGGLSYICYTLTVIPPAAPITRNNNISIEKEKPLVIEIPKLTAVAYPNPHKGSFNIRIISPEEGIAKVELFAANGQKLAERNVAVNAGENNNVSFTGIKQGTVFYRVQIGKQMANGKVMGIE